MSAAPPRLLFLLRHGPSTSERGEWLDAVLTFAAFDADITILLLDVGVQHLHLHPHSSPQNSGVSGDLLENLRFFGIDALWAERESMIEQNLPADELPSDIQHIGRAEIADFLNDFDQVFGR
jgi:sulfur relay protein TusC/DsrF